MTDDLKNLGRTTQTIHAGQHVDEATGAVAPPIIQSSTFAFADCAQGAARFAGEADGYIYTRMGNPTIARLEEAVATLEGGAQGLATGSGMAALCTVAFALLNQGDHLVGTSSVYGPSRVVMERDFSRFGVESTFVDTSDLDALRAAIRPNTKIVFVETPANPTIVLTDIAAAAEIAHSAGAVLLVDNTFASPVLQRPIEYGADIVMHSMTKFINGHTDVVAGMIVPSDRRDAHAAQTGPRLSRRLHGPAPGVARPARFQDPGAPGPRRPGQRGDHRRVPRDPPQGRVGPLTRVSRATPSTSSPNARWTAPARSSPSRSRAASRPAPSCSTRSSS